LISIREKARLQGFSDADVFPEDIDIKAHYKAIGNAVPLQLAA
jgi:site-specific DNA-cytosine methylase